MTTETAPALTAAPKPARTRKKVVAAKVEAPLPVAAVIENGLEMDPDAGEAFEAPLAVAPVTPDAPIPGDATPKQVESVVVADPAAPAPKAPKPARDRRNGILYPVPGTQIAACWALIEEVEQTLGRPAEPADLKAGAVERGLNFTTAGLCLHQRRKFYKAGA